jgi:hypothetical protein
MDPLAFPLRFVLAVLVTWRVTHLLAAEDGPADIIVRFRALLGNSAAGRMMDCFNCLSMWIAAAASLFVTRLWLPWLMTWLAVSGAACLLDRLGQQPVLIQAPSQTPQGEINHVLRTETNRAQEQLDQLDTPVVFRSPHTGSDPDKTAPVYQGAGAFRAGARNIDDDVWPPRRA